MTAFASTTPDFLERFEERIHSALHDTHHGKHEPRVLLEASRHLTFAGAAKRMRPLLVDHFGAALGVNEETRLAIATSAELIHTASLLHDDVVDEGTERRGEPTVNAQWNNSVAVLGGDLMLCIALEQLAALPRQVTFDAVQLVAEMTRAAMLEVEARNSTWDLKAWERIADGKTGSLLAWCGTAPAVAAGFVVEAPRFGTCGRHLGLAFQLTDDLLDLVGNMETIGKDPLADLRNKNPSFPVALARDLSPALATKLDDLWAQSTLEEEELRLIADEIVTLGVPQKTLIRVENHLDQALDALGEFASRPGGEQIAQWAHRLRFIARSSLEKT